MWCVDSRPSTMRSFMLEIMQVCYAIGLCTPGGYKDWLQSDPTRRKAFEKNPRALCIHVVEQSRNCYGRCLWHACSIHTMNEVIISPAFIFRNGKTLLVSRRCPINGFVGCVPVRAFECVGATVPHSSHTNLLFPTFSAAFERRLSERESRDVPTNNFWPLMKSCQETKKRK